MSAVSTSFKLGVLVLASGVTLLIVAIVFGVRVLHEDTVEYHIYFDESVQGLELGSPVKYRGVTVGRIEDIVLAPDRRHVDVVAGFELDTIRELGLTKEEEPSDNATDLRVPPDLRAQLGTQGITGVKFVNIDFFADGTRPPPELPFEPARNYIPAETSFLKELADSVDTSAQRLPELIDASVATLARIEHMLEDLDDQQLPARMAKTLEETDAAIRSVRAVVQQIDRAKIPDKAASTLAQLDTTAASVNRILARLDGEDGLLASSQRASEAVGELGRSASGSADELERTLRDLGEAARAVRELADLIERDPDVLVNGRAPQEAP